MADNVSFTVTFNGGEKFDITCAPIDFVKVERYTGKPIQENASPGLEAMYYMAFSAAQRAGKAGTDFDAWLSDVASVDAVEDEAPKA